MSTYLEYESIQTDGNYTYFEESKTQDPNNPTTNLPDVTIESIDAAASSLQLGTDIFETQVVEIGSAEVTTTIYGPMNILHAINASSLSLDYDLDVGGNAILHNLSAAELTSTRLDTGIVTATSLNVDGTSLLGTLYAGNCSLMNVSTARIDAEQLTVKGNCSMFNVSMVRIDANTLTANDTVSSAKLNVVNVLTSAPIPTAYTTVSAAVGTDIQLSLLTSVTPNGAFGPAGDYYSYTSSNVPEFNTINGTLDTSYKVFAQTTYRVCISVNYANNAANLSFQDGAGTLYTLGLTNTLTTYILYLKATRNSPLYLTVFRSATSGSVEIELASLSIEPWCETNVTTLNATGSALLASSGGVVGIGTTQPAYTLDVSGTMRVTGNTTIHKLTLSEPITSAYTTVPTSGQIGFVATTILNATDATLGADPFTTTSFTSKSLAKVNLTAGTWLLTANINAPQFTTTGYVILSIGTIANTFTVANDNYVQSATNTSYGLGYFVSVVAQITANTSYYMTVRTSVTGQTVNYYKFKATRIA